jgi:hypothetical protein
MQRQFVSYVKSEFGAGFKAATFYLAPSVVTITRSVQNCKERKPILEVRLAKVRSVSGSLSLLVLKLLLKTVLEQEGWKFELTERAAGDSASSLVPRDLHTHPVFAALFGAESTFFGTVHVFLGLYPQNAYACVGIGRSRCVLQSRVMALFAGRSSRGRTSAALCIFSNSGFARLPACLLTVHVNADMHRVCSYYPFLVPPTIDQKEEAVLLEKLYACAGSLKVVFSLRCVTRLCCHRRTNSNPNLTLPALSIVVRGFEGIDHK